MRDQKADSREIELKLEATGRQLRRLRKKQLPKELASGHPQRQKLRSVYFDTDDHALQANGVALRIRRVGDQWVQTIKMKSHRLSGLSRAVEIEAPVCSAQPKIDQDALAQLPGKVSELFSRPDLRPIFETVITRTTRQLTADDGSQIEIAFDKGKIRAGKHTCDIREVELELKSGHASALYSVAREMFEGEALLLSHSSKSTRGYQARSGNGHQPVRAAKFVHPKIKPGQPARKSLRLLLRACTWHISHNWRAMMTDGDIDATHQFRVGLRRLRSILSSYRKYVRDDRLKRIASDAKSLARQAGELRDTDVLIADVIAAPDRSALNSRDLDGLTKTVEARQSDVRSRIISKTTGDRILALLLQVGELSEALDSNFDRAGKKQRKTRDLAREALEASWQQCQKRGYRIEALDIEESHRLRKDLKKLRYQAEFFGGLYKSGEVKTFLKRLRNLQNLFGYLNDVAMAEGLLTSVMAQEETPVRVEHSASFVLGWHHALAADARRRAAKRWQQLARLKPFWSA